MDISAMAIPMFTILVSVSLLAAPAVSNYTPANIKSWCSQTPNPKPCEYFMSHKPHSFAPKTKSEFLKMAIQTALDRALHAQSHTMWLGSTCHNRREKVAWADCLELYQSTILRLNRTIDPSVKCTGVDTQTWLSTALANLETCRTGFVELDVSDYMLPLMFNNVSKLICNTLAINKAQPSGHEPNYKDRFPTWFSPGDRKLLQSSDLASKANLVVAKDGSGNFKTIKEAIDAAAKLRRTGRFIIYVNEWIYNENVEISNKLTNIMLVGDEMGKTVVTGSRSVGGGSTTFSSATVGKESWNKASVTLTISN